MPEKTVHELINQSFAPIDKKSWARAAALEIGGNNPDEALAWSQDGMVFQAYYDQKDVANLANQNDFQLLPATDSFSGPRSWKNLPSIVVIDEKLANKNALTQLASGADGILFDIRHCSPINFFLLLDEIDWPSCSISFLSNVSNPISKNVTQYIQQKKYDSALLTGSIYWDGPIEINNLITLPLSDLKNFQSCGLLINSSTSLKEISESLVKGVNRIEQLIESGIPLSIAIQQIAFSIPISNNFFLEIAKLKALRKLWFQIVCAYTDKTYSPSQLHLHSRSERWINATFQPNANMLKSTTSALAAILGGCNSLTVYAEDDSKLMNRIALNLSNVLREESYADKVADPTAGAYAIEKMVDEIEQAAWLDFQQNVNRS